MTEANNIIKLDFGKARVLREEHQAQLEDMDLNPIEMFSDAMIEEFVDILDREFDMDIESNYESLYELFVMSEAMRSVMYRLVGERHHFQMIAEDLFKMLNPGVEAKDFFEEE